MNELNSVVQRPRRSLEGDRQRESMSSVNSSEPGTVSRPKDRFCKRCGLVIDAGKAFELAGSNWHTFCFKCSRCDNQLDTETKLLLQGDELICGNCSYTCYSCGKRIEDLAILTGDQAFCAGCFVCRNCKKRIEDLKYARTNQGVFCMGCHEALLARKTRRLLKEKELRERERERERAILAKNKSLPMIPQDDNSPSQAPRAANTSSNSSKISLTNGSSAEDENKSNNSNNNSNNRRVHSSSNSVNRTAIYLEDADNADDGPSGEIPLFLGSPVLNERQDPEGSVLRGLQSPAQPERGRHVPPELSLSQSLSPNGSASAISGGSSEQLTSSGNIKTTMLSLPERSALRPQSPSPREQREQRVRRVPVGHRSQSYDSSKSPSSPSSAYSVRNEPFLSSAPNVDEADPALLPAAVLTPRDMLSSPMSLKSKSSEDDLFSTPAGLPSNNAKSALGASALRHRRSASDSPSMLSPLPGANITPLAGGRIPGPINTNMDLDELSVSDPASPNSPLVQLSEARQKIAYLESVGPTAKQLEDEIAEKRKTVANLEAKSRVAEREIRILNKTEKERDGKQMIEEFAREMASMKNSLISEIQNLIISRDELKSEISRLLQESTLLNIKNTQLADMNNELQSQILSKYSATQTQHPGYLPSSGSNGLGGAGGGYHPHHQPSSSNGQNYVTVLEGVGAQQAKAHHTRKFWRRPGAAVAKGLKGVFASEVEYGPGPGGMGSTGNGPPAVTVLSPPMGPSNGPVYTNGGPSPGGGATGGSGGGTDNSVESLEQRSAEEDRPVPLIVTRCIEEVEKRGLYSEGIYRKSGAKSQVDNICEAFASQDSSRIESALEAGDIAGTAGVLKQYLRRLPDPVITFDSYNDFIKVGGSTDKLRAVIHRLPPAHHDTLKAVMLHLHTVSEQNQRNLMTSKNLAVVFAPTLARDPGGDREMIDMHARNEVTQLMIDHANELFNKND